MKTRTTQLFPKCEFRAILAIAAGAAWIGMAVPAAAQTQASLTGTWNGAVLEVRSNCASAANNGSHGTYAQIDVGIASGTISVTQSGITGLRCDYTGTYSQAGNDQQASGTFLCSDGRRGTWLATQIFANENALTLKFSEQLNTTETCAISAVIGGARLSASNPPLPSIDYTGAWYNASESGWGISIVKGASNTLGVIIYHYDPDHSPAWFILQNGTWQNATTFSGTLYRFSGPAYTETFNPGSVSNTQAGSATLTFTSATAGTLAFTIGTATRTVPITRISF